MADMEPQAKRTRVQFRLRSLLLATMWFALIVAVCVKYQHAATRHREALESLQAARLLPPARVPLRPQPRPVGFAPRSGPVDREQ